MKLKIKTSKLLYALTPCQNLVEKRSILPILSKILIKMQEGELRIFATDQENSLQSAISVSGEEGEVCVDARNLFEIVKEISEEEVLLESFEKKRNLKVKTASSVFDMVGTHPENFPIFPNLKDPRFFSIQAEDLKTLIEKTSFCISTDETRYHLNGVFCEKLSQNLRFVATDGHRLSYAETKEPSDLELEDGIIIPRKGLLEIGRLLNLEDKKEVEIAVYPPRILVKSGSFLLSTRLIEGKYPSYKNLIPKDLKYKITFDREVMTQALRRVSILSNLQSRNVHFKWKKKQAVLTASHPDMGSAKEEVPLKTGCEDIEIRFNAKYVLEALSHCDPGEVILEMNASSSPGIIRSPSSKAVFVIMPMKL